MSDQCDNCGEQLFPVFPDQSRRWDDHQYVGCLHVYLDGGYGEYIDRALGSYHFQLCEKCAEEFVAETRWVELS